MLTPVRWRTRVDLAWPRTTAASLLPILILRLRRNHPRCSRARVHARGGVEIALLKIPDEASGHLRVECQRERCSETSGEGDGHRVARKTGWGYNGGRGIMPRPRRSVVGLCIAVIALAAFLPGISSLEYALVAPQWVLLPDDTPVAVCIIATYGDEQPVPLVSLLPSRAPPSFPLA